MENFDNWEMLKTAVEAEETEEILTSAIITDFENITKHQHAAVTIKQEKNESFENNYNVDLLNSNNDNNHNDNDVTIKKESIEISVDETDLDGGNSMDDDAIFDFANGPVDITKDVKKFTEEEQEHEESKTQIISANLTLTGRPVRAAAIAKSGLTQKHALDEPPLDYESAIIYMCPACGCEYFSHEAWKRHMHVQHKFNTPEGLNFKKIDKLYNECQQCFKPIAMHSIENLLKHKFTHLPFRCTKCRICMRQYKYRQDLMVHLRMTHLADLAKIKETGEWTKENKAVLAREKRESTESNNSIFAIKDVQANAIDIHGGADSNNHDDSDTVCVQNERLELDEDEQFVEYDTNESHYHNKLVGIQQTSLLESALSAQLHNDGVVTGEEPYSEPDIKLCEPYIMHICPQCGDTYEKQEQWQEHIEVEHNFGNAMGLGFELLENNTAVCKECSKMLPNEILQLQLHRFAHTRHRQWMRCSLCYRAFTLLKDLIRHLLVQHNLVNSPPDDYEDMENYQSETHRDNFEQHIEYLCPQCGRNYKDRKLWRRHLIYAHRLADLKVLKFRVINETQVICLDCKKVITNAYGIQNAQQHCFTHMPFKAYIRCRICNKSYTERKGTVKHLRKTHHISNTNNSPIATTTTRTSTSSSSDVYKLRFEDNNSYYSKRTTLDPRNNKPQNEIVRTNNYMFEIKFLDDGKTQKVDNYSTSINDSNNQHHKHKRNYSDDDSIDDNAAVPELIFDNNEKHNTTQYKCNYCAARFTHHRTLTQHIIDSHSKQKEHKHHGHEEPPYKKIRLKENDDDKLKKNNLILENYYYFLCPACGKEFPEQSSWRQHINEIHYFNKRHGLNFKPISPYSYQCLQCDVIVDSKLQTMQEHKFGHLPYVRCVKCRLCTAAFSWKSKMLEHLCIKHNISETKTNISEENIEQQTIENKLLKISKITATSTSTRDSPTLSAQLPVALTSTVITGTEYAHNAVDHATITYFCPLCNENFVTHFLWRRHIVDVHNLNNCEGLNFRKINEHHFLCLQCYKRVTVTHTKGAICQLQSHKFRHLPYRSFKCTACNEMFVRKQMFFKHLNKLTNQCGAIKQKMQSQHKQQKKHKQTKAQNVKKNLISNNDSSNDNSMGSVNNNQFVNESEEQLNQGNEEHHLHQQQQVEGEKDRDENQEPFIFVCPSCGQEFYRLHLWREHINTEHNLNSREILNFKRITATQHQCLQCFECVNGRKLRDLQAHKFKHLTHTHYLRCLLCKASYTHLRNMQDHIRNRHPEVNAYKFTNTDDNRSFRSNEDTEESCLTSILDIDVNTNDLPSALHPFVTIN